MQSLVLAPATFQSTEMLRQMRWIFVFIFSIASGGFTATFAQQTAIASVSAGVVVPISMAKTVDMNFGNAAVSASTGGVLVLSPSGTRSTLGAGVTLPATVGTVSAAGFSIAGMPSYTFSITLPGSATVNGPGSSVLSINSFTSSPAVTGTLSTSGSCTLAVGGSLSISAGQPAGLYVNASAVPVTVNYN